MATIVYHRLREPVQFVVNPSAVIQSNTATYGGGRMAKLRQAGKLLGFYILNLLLYAFPLTAAGFGVEDGDASPPTLFETLASGFVADVNSTWLFVEALVVNSVFLLVLSGVVFFAFHVGVLITNSSNGILQSSHTVIYSTGVYLAALFTITWAVSTTPGIVVADDLLLAIQKEFIYFFIDLTGQQVTLPGGRPDPVDLSRLTRLGKFALTGTIVTSAYFLYSLYLGGRLNHNASRPECLIAVVFVAFSPGMYVTGSIAVATLFGGVPV